MTGPGRLLISAWPPRQADGGRPPRFALLLRTFFEWGDILKLSLDATSTPEFLPFLGVARTVVHIRCNL